MKLPIVFIILIVLFFICLCNNFFKNSYKKDEIEIDSEEGFNISWTETDKKTKKQKNQKQQFQQFMMVKI